MVQTVNLDENEHAVTVLRGLKQMKNEQDLCDFIIKVGGVEYQTHKNILSVGSPYFKAMLKHDTKESREGKVEMKDVDPDCVKSCIDFLYSGNFGIPDGKIGQLLHVAIMLQLDKVKVAISDVMDESLNAENFYESQKIAKVFDLKSVSGKCKKYYNENLLAISSQPGFKNEEKSHILHILKSKYMNLSEEEKLTVSLKWVGENSAKKENLFELLKLINLKAVSPEFLSDLLENHPVINNDLQLYRLISSPLVENAKSNATSPDSRNQIVLFDWEADCMRLYDPVTDEVTKFQNESFRHLGDFSAVSIDSYIYVLCGDKSVHRLNFRDENSKWERMQDMVEDHGPCPPVVMVAGSFFVITSSYDPTSFVENFEPTANRWLKLNDKPKAVSGATLVSLHDSVFCIGGWDEQGALKSLCRFTPSSSEWVDLEPMKNARYWCGASAVDQRIFVMGGLRRNHTPLNEVECYDVAIRNWTSLTAMMKPHGVSVAHHVEDWIYLVGRCENVDKVEKYDTTNNKWCRSFFKNADELIIYGSLSVKI